MECITCKSKSFFKHDSGFLVCSACFTQAKAPEQKSDDFSSTPATLKRKLRLTSKKLIEKKHCKSYSDLSWDEYLNHYKSLLIHCINSMIKRLRLKKEVFNFANGVFECFVPSAKRENILPKNRRKRVSETPCRYPKNKAKLLKSIEERDGMSSKQLAEICGGLGMAEEKERAKSTVVIYSSNNPELNLIRSEVPMDVSNILVIAYVSMLYSYSDTRGVMASDIIEWAYNGVIPYFSAYLHLNIQKQFQSLFKPLSIPSTQWLRKAIGSCPINCTSSFSQYHQYILNLFTHCCSLLGLGKAFAENSYKIYKKTSNLFKGSSLLPEVIVAGHILSFLKLVYGLNDIPYTLELRKTKLSLFTRENLCQMEANMDKTSEFILGLPSLTSIFDHWEQKLKENSLTFQVNSIGSCRKYFEHLSQSCCFVKDDKLCRDYTETKVNTRYVEVIRPDVITNRQLLEEVAHVISEDVEYHTPASDFWVQKKKCGDKDYPFEYLFAVHSIASLCGGMMSSQINFICDKIDRLIAAE